MIFTPFYVKYTPIIANFVRKKSENKHFLYIFGMLTVKLEKGDE
jgi:hypothetical protein